MYQSLPLLHVLLLLARVHVLNLLVCVCAVCCVCVCVLCVCVCINFGLRPNTFVPHYPLALSIWCLYVCLWTGDGASSATIFPPPAPDGGACSRQHCVKQVALQRRLCVCVCVCVFASVCLCVRFSVCLSVRLSSIVLAVNTVLSHPPLALPPPLPPFLLLLLMFFFPPPVHCVTRSPGARACARLCKD